ncbi:hypothetical protein M3183_00930 [Neobacillus mesonae]|nr:hypothetical protein [Neobacillus mesonae]
MKNRTSVLIIGGLIILALIGLFSSFMANPAGFIQKIALMAVIGFVIFFVVRKFSNSSPQKKEQRAFLKAAKQSKKRLQQKNGDSQMKSSSLGPISNLKKHKTKRKSNAHLTVIDGKKGKKKNRASL